MRIADFIEKTAAAETSEEVFETFRTAVGELGYDRIGLVAVNPAAQIAVPAGADMSFVLARAAPEEWVKHYAAQRYHEIDPVLQQVPNRRIPFFWSDLLKEAKLSVKQRALLEESREHGMQGGISIPVHGPSGEAYVISLARSTGAGDDRALIAPLHTLGVNFFLNFSSRIARPEPQRTVARLTDRERECLSWSANGKSAWAISQIIGVSENTVNFHLKSAMKKLGTSNRVQAVAIAVRTGLIHPT